MAEERVPLSPKIREPVRGQLDSLVEEFGGNRGTQKVIVEAAILAFADLPQSERRRWMQKVQSAETSGGTRQIVREIRAKYASEVKGSGIIEEEPT